MKPTSRMTFSSFGGLFAGPPRCATAIVRDGDNTGPGGGNAATELLDATVDAGKNLARAVEQELSGRFEPKIVVPVYPLARRQTFLDTGFVCFPSENRGYFAEETRIEFDNGKTEESPHNFLFQSSPVDGALAWLYGNGLGVLEEFLWLCRHRRAFPAAAMCRILYEVSCNARWIYASDSEKRAKAFWEYIRSLERIKRARQENVGRAAEEIHAMRKGNLFFDTSLFCKAKSFGGLEDYADIYGVSSDMVHGHHFWVLPTSEMTESDMVAMSIVACREFVRMAEAVAKCCGIPRGEWSALFGKAERRLEEESRRLLKTAER